jgi:hypothetical protein
MKLLLPEDCIKSDVCKYVGDNGCWNGCDYRIEKLHPTTANVRFRWLSAIFTQIAKATSYIRKRCKKFLRSGNYRATVKTPRRAG